ncbi:Lipoxygenase [Pluteus cervinus]|uniref:Lipoxygenase n=1 Tax=Pluteus cervinus TaxID=181527 RepID=A0ACD3A8G9_9AGAR|nr:Lipoxygenase [Pluteus cervinus]
MSHTFLKVGKLPQLHSYRLSDWDAGVFDLEVTNLGIIPPTSSRDSKAGAKNSGKKKPKPQIGRVQRILISLGIRTRFNLKLNGSAVSPSASDQVPPVKEGSFKGTLMALTQAADRVDSTFSTYFAALGIETHVPIPRTRAFRQSVVTWDRGDFPPHCAVIPKSQEASALAIFDNLALANVASIIRLLVPNPSGNIIEWVLKGIGSDVLLDIDPVPAKITSIADIENFNSKLRARLFSNAYELPNVGDRKDWYTDRVFAEQQFVGANPVTIAAAPADLLQEFYQEAVKQSSPAATLLASLKPQFLFVQDCRYFREAIGADPNAELKDDSTDNIRYGCASVTLFYLTAEGVLHPLAVVLDYRVSMANSIVIFNKRLRATDSTASEATDWPWRYAKLCSQVADWARHEIAVHLAETHFVEEGVIVAALRSFEVNHPVYQILSPHWLRTLSLNASARGTLVPDVVIRLVGFTEAQSYKFINNSYENFDWEGSYVPNHLKGRGFPSDEAGLNDKMYHNYAFARSVIVMWNVIRAFVHDLVSIYYNSDSAVAQDVDIQTWCDEARGDNAGRLKKFPAKIQTIESLVNVITMCIHIATNQHTAVNYLQQYYMTFVINKPAALCVPLPKSLDDLRKYKEQNLLDSYPINRPAEWLLASHVPWLLSFRVEAMNNSLSKYASSLYTVNKNKSSPTKVEVATAAAAERFYNGLKAFTDRMLKISSEMDDQTVPYSVLHPDANAVSILT